MATFTIENFLICEQIRTERYNKLSLLGVYSDRTIIIKDKPPVQIPLALYLSVKCHTPDEIRDDIKINLAIYDPDNKMLANQIRLIGEKPTDWSSQIMNFNLNINNFPIKKVGNYRFVLKIDGQEIADIPPITVKKVDVLPDKD